MGTTLSSKANMRAPVSFIFLTVAVANADPEAYTIGQVALGHPHWSWLLWLRRGLLRKARGRRLHPRAGGSRTSPAQRLRHRPPPQCRRSHWSRLLWLQPRLLWQARG